MDRALLASYVEGSYTMDERIMAKAVQEIAGELPPPPKQEKSRSIGSLISSIFTMRTAIGAAALVATLALVAVAVEMGVRLANVKARRVESTELAAANENGSDSRSTATQALSDATTDTSKAAPPPAAPTPPPDWDELRKSKPNWKYEKNAPLVRVNNPRTVFRAAQLSLLKMWGIAVDLSEMSKLGEDTVTQGEFKSEKVKIQTLSISGDYDEATRFDLPLIAHLTDTQPNESEFVVLLQSQGETATVGDPIWGVKFYKTEDLRKKWGGAQTLFVDVYQLSTLKKGDRSDRVRVMQQFLKEFLSDYADDKKSRKLEVNGLFDVSTTDAIRQFQSYYELPDTGQLDNMTLMLLNAHMMRNGPRLRNVEVN